jgi:hypothetical protein
MKNSHRPRLPFGSNFAIFLLLYRCDNPQFLLSKVASQHPIQKEGSQWLKICPPIFTRRDLEKGEPNMEE